MNSWRRDVPMPARVAALPRTDAGIPITYTVAWTSERKPFVAPDSALESVGLGQAPAIFSKGRPGLGAPRLGMTETSRQRRSVVLGLCQVCGGRIEEATEDRPRWLCDLRIAGQVVRLGQVSPLVVDSWTCRECLPYSLRVCPGLLRKGAELRLLRVRRYSLVPTIERAPYITAAELPYGPIGYVKIAPTDYDTLPATTQEIWPCLHPASQGT